MRILWDLFAGAVNEIHRSYLKTCDIVHKQNAPIRCRGVLGEVASKDRILNMSSILAPRRKNYNFFVRNHV